MTPRETLASLFRAWDAADALRASAHFAADATYQEARHEAIVGRDAIMTHFVRFFRDGPHFAFKVEDVLVEDERAAVAYHFRIETIPGAWLERPGCALVHFNAATIARWREFEG